MGPDIRGSIKFFVFGIAVLPILAVPYVFSLSYTLQKGPIALLALTVALILAAVSIARGGARLELPLSFAAYSGVLLVIIALASFVSSAFGAQGMLAGRSIEVGTFASIVLFALAIVAGATLSLENASAAYKVFTAAAVISAVPFAISNFFGADSGGLFLAGALEQLPILLTVALVLSAICADVMTRASRTYFRAAFSASAMLGVFFIDVATAWTGLACALCAAVIIIVLRKMNVPWMSVIACACLLSFVFISGSIQRPEYESQARPSFLATSFIAGSEFGGSMVHMLLGEGPHTFAYAWNRYRMSTFNESPLWSVTPSTGSASIPTFAIFFGILGLVSLAIVPGSVIALGVRAYRVDHERIVRALPAYIGALVLFIAAFFHTLELPLFLMMGLLFGISVAMLTTESGRSLRVDFPLSAVPSLSIGVVLVVAAVWIGQVAVRQFLAADLHTKGRTVFSEDPSAGLRLMERAFRTWKDTYYALEASRAYVAAADDVIKRSDTETARSLLSSAASAAGSASDADPSNFDAWIARAHIGIERLLLREDIDSSEVREYLKQARSFSPNRPDVPYEQARLELILGDKKAARESLEVALSLKADYEDATALRSKLLVDPNK